MPFKGSEMAVSDSFVKAKLPSVSIGNSQLFCRRKAYRLGLIAIVDQLTMSLNLGANFVQKRINIDIPKKWNRKLTMTLTCSISMEGDTGQKCNCSGTACCIISYHALIPETTRCVVISYPICRFIVLLKP